MGILDSVFDTSNEAELLKSDKGFSGTKIEESGVFLVKVVMAKQVDSGSSASKNFKLEFETEKGAKLYWDAGWYIGKKGDNLDSKGNLLIAAASLARANYLITGSKDLPVCIPKVIKEYDWDLKTDVDVNRNVAADMIGKFIKVQVVRKRVNKQVNSGKVDSNGYNIWVDGPEERFINEVKRFYDASTNQTFGEKMLAKPGADIAKDEEYCAKTPLLDKYKEVSAVAAAATPAAAAAAPTSGFGA